MSLPALDVMAVLADLQQQLTDLTAVVETQQRTLHQLLKPPSGTAPALGTREVTATTAGLVPAAATSAGSLVRGPAG